MLATASMVRTRNNERFTISPLEMLKKTRWVWGNKKNERCKYPYLVPPFSIDKEHYTIIYANSNHLNPDLCSQIILSHYIIGIY
jgi:hypothetical protein